MDNPRLDYLEKVGSTLGLKEKYHAEEIMKESLQQTDKELNMTLRIRGLNGPINAWPS